MWYADTVGLKRVHDRISEFHRTHGELWEPTPLLQQLAAEERTFADLEKQKVAAG
jgi:3-hydroxyacyl-CoA dehydrogenase